MQTKYDIDKERLFAYVKEQHFVKGFSYSKIADDVNEQGFRTHDGNLWTTGSLCKFMIRGGYHASTDRGLQAPINIEVDIKSDDSGATVAEKVSQAISSMPKDIPDFRATPTNSFINQLRARYAKKDISQALIDHPNLTLEQKAEMIEVLYAG